MNKNKKIGLIVAGAVELALIVFCLIVSILVMSTLHTFAEYGNEAAKLNLENNGPMIGWFQNNPTPFFLIIVVPMLVILVVDVVYIVMYAVKRESNLSEQEMKILEEQARNQAKDELRAEIMAELEEEEKKKGEKAE